MRISIIQKVRLALVLAVGAAVASCGNPGEDVNAIIKLFAQADVARLTLQDAIKNNERGERPVRVLLPDWERQLTAAVSRLESFANFWSTNASKEDKQKYDVKVNVELKEYLRAIFTQDANITLMVPPWNVGETTFSYPAFATDRVRQINLQMKLVIAYYKRLFPGEDAPDGEFKLMTQIDRCLKDTRPACVEFYREKSALANNANEPGGNLCQEHGLQHCGHQMDLERMRNDLKLESRCAKEIRTQTSECIKSHEEPDLTNGFYPDGGYPRKTVCDEYRIAVTLVEEDWLRGSAHRYYSDTLVIDSSQAGCK